MEPREIGIITFNVGHAGGLTLAAREDRSISQRNFIQFTRDLSNHLEGPSEAFKDLADLTSQPGMTITTVEAKKSTAADCETVRVR